MDVKTDLRYRSVVLCLAAASPLSLPHATNPVRRHLDVRRRFSSSWAEDRSGLVGRVRAAAIADLKLCRRAPLRTSSSLVPSYPTLVRCRCKGP